ncbi:MAG: serine/threonine-protein kinase [Deltaproteobacteria bacterium]|nr:serine/threonine-protein kinase [Deltaproteobacteria bacterium]
MESQGSWQRVKAVVAEALELPPAQRSDFLDRSCGEQPALRREVESLLESYDSAGGFLESPAAESLAPLLSSSQARLHKIGPYRVGREIGRGGMGAVFLASREDPAFQHVVAVKLIKRGMDSDEIVRRFHQERDILARLDHPHIARLLDGGTTKEGQPYFVMEYIEGLPFDRYCDIHQLSVRRRLEVFRVVCGAVQFAHRNLVIHRDLKPSNILVTEEGQPKLLDFGIAKLLDADESAPSGQPTVTAQRRLTPRYASPEQILGDPVTTGSDVYSLGVLLYELLTGRLPNQPVQQLGAGEARSLRESSPERPSSIVTRDLGAAFESTSGQATQSENDPAAPRESNQVSRLRGEEPHRLSRLLKGDLDNIVLKALSPEPDRRYGSVEQLSEDLRRYLEGRPVVARRSTFAYRASKFIRRNRVLSLAMVLLAALVLSLAWQRLEIGRERDRADTERAKAQQALDFVLGLFEISDPETARGERITAREILDRGASQLEQETGTEPQVRAVMMDTVGEIYRKLGLFERAAPLLEGALEVRSGALGASHLDAAESLDHLAQLEYAKGEFERAAQLHREALGIREGQLGREDPAVAKSLVGVGMAMGAGGEVEEGIFLVEEGLEIQRRLWGKNHPEVASSLNNLAVLRSSLGEYSAAAELVQQALMIQRLALGEDHPHVATGELNAGTLLYQSGDYEAAEPVLLRALELNERLLGEEHPRVAVILTTVATLYFRRGELDRAEPLLRQALEVSRKALGESHPDTATTLDTLAAVVRHRGDLAESEEIYRQALAMRKTALGPEHPAVASSLNNLAFVAKAKGDLVEAEALQRRAVEIRRSALGEDHPDVGLSLNNLGSLLLQQEKLPEAEAVYRKALAVRRSALPESHPDLAFTQTGLARLLLEQGRTEEAVGLLREAVAIRRQALPAGHWRLAESESLLGLGLGRLGQVAEAQALLVGSTQILLESRGESHPATQRARQALLELEKELGTPLTVSPQEP